MLGYLSADIICSKKRTVFRDRSSRKTVSFEDQKMSKDKYLSIFSPQMETIMFIILQIFYATHAVLKIGRYSRISPSFSWWIFGPVTCLDQSRAGAKIWWISRAEMAQWEEGSPLTSVPYVSLLLVLTLLGGFFSGYSGFPHIWKTNISKFQFELAFSLNIFVASVYHYTAFIHLGYFNKFEDMLLWVNWGEEFFDESYM